MMAGTSLKAIVLVLAVSFIVAEDIFCSKQWNMTAVDQTTLGLMANGSLYAWGSNQHGEAGPLSNKYVQLTPERVNPVMTFKCVSEKVGRSFAITTDGRLFSWGLDQGPRVNPLFPHNQYIPLQIGNASDWSMVSNGVTHVLALKQNGSLYAWGGSEFGQVGSGDNKEVPASNPVHIMPGFTWRVISAGRFNSFAIRSDGALFAWGQNEFGKLGDGSKTNRFSPVRIGGSSDSFIAVSPGESHTLAIDTMGNLFAWGRNDHGQIGYPSNWQESLVPIIPESKGKWKAVSAGWDFSLAIKTDGSLWGFGTNSDLQLGNENKWDQYTPVEVLPGQKWKSVSAGFFYAFGVTNEGQIIGWGDNLWGYLGDGTRNTKKLPARCPSKGGLKAKLVNSVKQLMKPQ